MIQPNDLQSELARRLSLYESSARVTASQFAAVMGAAQAVGAGSPLGDMQTNRFCLPMVTSPSTDVWSLQSAIAAAALPDAIAREIDRVQAAAAAA